MAVFDLLAAVLDENPGLPEVGAGTDVVTGIIIPTISTIVGAVSVIFVIIGGARYVLSGGAPEKIQQAKNTILYACIGLLVAIMSVTIVRFVVDSL